jgi:hypothetical protein
MRCATANSKVISRVLKRFDHAGMIGEPEVVIAAKTGDLTAINDHLGLLWGFSNAAAAIKTFGLSLSQRFLELPH